MSLEQSVTADHYWDAGWKTVPNQDGHSGGTLLPPLRDHHVHLGLIDTASLAGSALSAVDDLGWTSAAAQRWQAHGLSGRTVRAVGPFLTKLGGYPFGRAWAPDDAVRQISSARDAAAAVLEVAEAGFHSCKVALNADLPLLDTEELQTLVRVAHDCGLSVVAHVEGAGQARRAFEAGVDVFAHAPWSERLDEHLIADMAGIGWISTLAIHEQSAGDSYAIALANTASFHRSGGTVLYGTDMGNGTTQAALNPVELGALLAAGMDAHAIIASATAVGDESRVTWSPLPPPRSDHEFVTWCQTLRSIPNGRLGDDQ